MTKLSIYDPAFQYQTQKNIQNTIRVPSSLYTMNLGALSVYETPLNSIKVNWNQMSDRKNRHIQPNSGNSQGSFYHGSSTKHTQTRNRPGAGTPGGKGVDIKHNSYHRYLSRIKAEKPIRRGIIPPTYGLPIVFNRAIPIYGGKTVKTSITNNSKEYICDKNDNPDCSYKNMNNFNVFTEKLNKSSFSYDFSVGQEVFSRSYITQSFQPSTIIEVLENNYYIVETVSLDSYKTYVTNIIPRWNCIDNINPTFNTYSDLIVSKCGQTNYISNGIDFQNVNVEAYLNYLRMFINQ